ncbi:hypothetical protein [Anaeropeptidivorans aminofermentans]|jgi:uncharacterized C2H2 Zn-finger protein|uniref:hypothetical protein n=1 Tax=Anaeropeptidivorans aminofermentans TaxID=2934315 RepID=UPI002024D5C4|nr:hypothetical protein [Anaeropeptidivorans aminofermentans]
MIGRYGVDDFNRFLNALVFILLILGIFISRYFTYLGLVVIVYEYFRVFSRDISKRFKENIFYLNKKRKIDKWIANKKIRISQRKTHRFYTCPSCKKTVRIPKGKGKVMIKCPICNTEFEGKS